MYSKLALTKEVEGSFMNFFNIKNENIFHKRMSDVCLNLDILYTKNV
jgi:hypothetical protein